MSDDMQKITTATTIRHFMLCSHRIIRVFVGAIRMGVLNFSLLGLLFLLVPELILFIKFKYLCNAKLFSRKVMI
jgi:hypothetical protein